VLPALTPTNATSAATRAPPGGGVASGLGDRRRRAALAPAARAAYRRRVAEAPHPVVQEVVTRTVELAAVPAPTGDEARRAALVAGWWRRDGLDGVRTDDAGNVWARLIRGDSARAVLLCAHLDTVFGAAVEHRVRRDGDRLRGPGVGDDTVSVAALAALRALVADRGRRTTWIVATTGEEGLGNLRGARHALATCAGLDAVIAVEGHGLGAIVVTGLGSLRARIDVDGPGGHPWAHSERASALHGAARAVAALAAERASAACGWTWHVGCLRGGEAINSLAAAATFDLEIRAGAAPVLAEREARARTLVAAAMEPGLRWRWSELGRRGAGGLPRRHPLARAAVAAHERHGRPWHWAEGPSDANAAYEAGIPALTLGLTDGDGEHTVDEWIDLRPLGTGLAILADTVAQAAGAGLLTGTAAPAAS